MPQPEPQRIDFEGNVHTFPADFTQAEIQRALKRFSGPAKTPEEKNFPSSGEWSDMVPKDAGEWADAAGSFLKGAFVNTAQGLAKAAERVVAGPQTEGEKLAFTAMGPLGPLVMDIARSHVETGAKAIESAKQGRYSEAAGYAGGALLPVVGPMAANIGEKIGEGKVAEGLGELAAPVVVPAAVRGTAAAGKSVASAPGVVTKAALGYAAGKLVPGGGMAVRALLDELARRKAATGPANTGSTAPPAPVVAGPAPPPAPPQRIAGLLEAPPRAMPPVADTSSVTAVPAKSTVARDPATGQMKRVYLSGEPMPTPAAEPIPPARQPWMPQRDPVTGRFVKSSAATPPPPAGAPPVSAPGGAAVPAARKSVAEISAELQAALDEGGNAMEQMAAKQVQSKAKAAQMEIGNRTLKVEAMVKLLREHNISPADAKRMNAEQWGKVAEAAGQKKPSAATQLQTIIELEKVE